MGWIAIFFALELGVLPMDAAIMYEPPALLVEPVPVFYQTFEMEALLWKHLALGGKVSIYEWKNLEEISFWPFRGGFEASAEFRFDPLRLGWRHYCTHPIATYFPLLEQKMKWEGSYEEIYIRLEVGR